MPDSPTLTDRQNQVYQFLKATINARGYGPTHREIALAFNIRICAVWNHLNALEKKGFIKREGNSARAVKLTGKRGIPLITPSSHVPAAESNERFEPEKLLGGRNRYALAIKNGSLIEHNVEPGDFIIIDRNRRNHTAKQVVEFDHRISIHDSPDLIPDRSTFLGELVGVVRVCR